MTPTPPACPPDPLEQVPPPEVILRRLRETAEERRLLVALLKVSKVAHGRKPTAPSARPGREVAHA